MYYIAMEIVVGSVLPLSLSVLPRDLNGKPLKVTTTTTHAFDRRGERGKRGEGRTAGWPRGDTAKK